MLLMHKAFQQIRDACVKPKRHVEFQYDFACLLLQNLELNHSDFRPSFLAGDIQDVHTRFGRWEAGHPRAIKVGKRRMRLENRPEEQRAYWVLTKGKWKRT